MGGSPAFATGVGDIPAQGAFTCDFTLDSTLPLNEVGPVLERDRMYMAQRPGMLHKHVPLRLDASANMYSGGRYLFSTEAQARDYAAWLTHGYVLDGTHFFERAYIIEPDCRAWKTIGATNFAELRTQQVVLRTERFHVPEAGQTNLLTSRYPLLRERAFQQGLTGVWLLYDAPTRTVSIVYFGGHLGQYTPDELNTVALAELEQAPPLGEVFADQGWEMTFDRTHWTLTLWLPATPGDTGEPSVWPNSPPLPEPYVGDGVCEPSRGENASCAPQDCPATCGDGVAHPPEETTWNCPSDVPAS